ncbi:MAG: prepilin-type N-terminal cleavage/methylation domain-containing protein [Phycisphaera sp. TMED9]|nr:MAG: prepilin-type N-terminal cleavage/methylation domain-containing protein [Phycisphaera sp. TMED9]
MRNRSFQRTHHASRRGFTLIESALATVIIGTGVLAMVAAQQTFHRQNDWAQHSANAMRLAGEIRELTLNMPSHDPVTGVEFWGPEPNESLVEDWDDIDDFDDAVFSFDLGNGPITAMRTPFEAMPGWSQRILVSNVDPFDIGVTLPEGTSEMIRVEVVVEYQGPTDLEPAEITRLIWIQPG